MLRNLEPIMTSKILILNTSFIVSYYTKCEPKYACSVSVKIAADRILTTSLGTRQQEVIVQRNT